MKDLIRNYFLKINLLLFYRRRDKHLKVKVWIIECMGKHAKLCIAKDQDEAEILVGLEVFADKQLLKRVLRHAKKEIRKSK